MSDCRRGFEIHDVEGLREHFQLTLEHWVERLYKNQEAAFAEIGIPEFKATRAVERIMRARPMNRRQQERERASIEEIALEFGDDAL